MEHPAIKDVIVLQTVREEIRHLSTPVYNRLNTILADKTKRFYMFANEHQRWVLDQSQCLFFDSHISFMYSDTFIEKLKGETPNDRNDRGKAGMPQ